MALNLQRVDYPNPTPNPGPNPNPNPNPNPGPDPEPNPNPSPNPTQVDLAAQLHHALFAHRGYVLKPWLQPHL